MGFPSFRALLVLFNSPPERFCNHLPVRFSSVKIDELWPMDGESRRLVRVSIGYRHHYLCVSHYKLPGGDDERVRFAGIQGDVAVINEKSSSRLFGISLKPV